MSDFTQSMLLLILVRIAVVCLMNYLSSAGKCKIYKRKVRDRQLKREDISVFLGPVVEPSALIILFHLGLIGVGNFIDLSMFQILGLVLASSFGWVFGIELIYYWLHRWLHTPKQMKKHHNVHHSSLAPRPAAGFSFTVTERLIYAVLFGSVFVIASHFEVLSIGYIWFMTLVFDVVNQLGHLNVEFFPKSYLKNKVLRNFLYSSSFHALHHSKFNCNYSLFMPIWDRIFKTAQEEDQLFISAKDLKVSEIKNIKVMENKFTNYTKKNDEIIDWDCFKGKNVLMVAATSSLAQELTERLSRSSANIFFIARSASRLKRNLGEVICSDSQFAIADITNQNEVNKSLEGASRYFKEEAIDYVFFCQGYIYAKQLREISAEHIEESLKVNYLSAVYFSMEMIKQQYIQKGSHLVFVSSVSTTLVCPETHTYMVAKRALESFADELLYELKPRGINITIAQPGFFKSRFIRGNKFTPFLDKPGKVADSILMAVKRGESHLRFPFSILSILYILELIKFSFPNSYFKLVNMLYLRARKKLKMSPPDLDLSKEDHLDDKFGWKRLLFGICPSSCVGFIKRMFKD